MQLWKCTQIIKLIFQLIADLPRGRTCNSKSGDVCPSPLEVSYQLTNSFDNLCTFSWFHFLFWLESKLIPAQTGYRTMKICTNCKTNFSFESWYPKRKDMQFLKLWGLVVWTTWSLNSKSLPPAISRTLQISVWAEIKINSSPNRKRN